MLGVEHDPRLQAPCGQTVRWHWLEGKNALNKSICDELIKCGGGVRESNPPFDSLGAESPALKAGTVTGPFSPPLEV